MNQPSRTPMCVVSGGDVEGFLRELIEDLAPDEAPRVGPGRPRILPALCLWAGLLVCVVQGLHSQLALWRLLSEQGLWDYPRFALSDQAIYKRLASAGTQPLQQLFYQVRDLLQVRLAPYLDLNPKTQLPQRLAAFATEVMALDESTLEQVHKHLPRLRNLPKGDGGLLGGKLAGLFDIRRQQWWQVEYRTDVRQNERVAARDLVAQLPPGSLVLADLGYFGFAWFDDLTQMGHSFVSRLRAKTSYTLLHTYYQQERTLDALVWLGKYRADRAAHAVRLVQFVHKGVSYQYITNVCDPHQLSLYEIALLYHRRWDFELALKMLKRHLNLHLLWSGKPAIIAQQLWATLIVAQVIQGLRLEIAGRAQVDPDEVSLALLVEYLPRFAKQGRDPVAVFVERGVQARFIRPSARTRIEAPVIVPDDIIALPPETCLQRTPRYAQRNC